MGICYERIQLLERDNTKTEGESERGYTCDLLILQYVAINSEKPAEIGEWGLGEVLSLWGNSGEMNLRMFYFSNVGNPISGLFCESFVGVRGLMGELCKLERVGSGLEGFYQERLFRITYY